MNESQFQGYVPGSDEDEETIIFGISEVGNLSREEIIQLIKEKYPERFI